MKTIFRFTKPALLLAVIIAFGAVAGLAQDPAPGPCEDAAGQGAASDKITELFKDKTLAGRMAYVEAGNTFLTKYGSCPSAKEMSDYLTPRLPKLEETIRDMRRQEEIAALAKPFNAAMQAKDWDKAYSIGKEALQKFPDEFRPAEIVLGSIGGEEALTKNNFKYTDETIKYAKQSIADLEAGKSFMVGNKVAYGLSLVDANKKVVYNFAYDTPAEAIAWLNFYIGWVTHYGQKNKVAALPYLYKATQANETKGKAGPYDAIGNYYIAELEKVYEEIKAIKDSQKDDDTEEAAKQKLDTINAKIAMTNGIAERVMDALARAVNLEKDAVVKAKLKTMLQEVYRRRFDKTEGVDAWVNAAMAKPFVNPQTPIEPIRDSEPVKPATTTTTTAPASPATPGAPASKPPATLPKPAAMPVAKPMSGSKPQAAVIK